jgi:fructokinase
MSFNVVGLGEVLWDILPAGRQLGGAPANFAHHARELGARAQVITRVGSDLLGREVIQRFESMNLCIDAIQLDEVEPTGTVAVKLASEGLPQYTFAESAAWDRLAVNDSALKIVRAADAICFGTLAQRCSVSRLSIRQLVAAAPVSAIRMFDINLRQQFYSREVIEQSLQVANMLKLNNEELSILTPMFSLTGDLREKLDRLTVMF